MVDPTHEPFVKLVASCVSKEQFTDSQIRDFLEGNAKSEILSKAFGYWSKGDNGMALKVLNPSEYKRQQEATANPV